MWFFISFSSVIFQPIHRILHNSHLTFNGSKGSLPAPLVFSPQLRTSSTRSSPGNHRQAGEFPPAGRGHVTRVNPRCLLPRPSTPPPDLRRLFPAGNLGLRAFHGENENPSSTFPHSFPCCLFLVRPPFYCGFLSRFISISLWGLLVLSVCTTLPFFPAILPHRRPF